MTEESLVGAKVVIGRKCFDRRPTWPIPLFWALHDWPPSLDLNTPQPLERSELPIKIVFGSLGATMIAPKVPLQFAAHGPARDFHGEPVITVCAAAGCRCADAGLTRTAVDALTTISDVPEGTDAAENWVASEGINVGP